MSYFICREGGWQRFDQATAEEVEQWKDAGKQVRKEAFAKLPEETQEEVRKVDRAAYDNLGFQQLELARRGVKELGVRRFTVFLVNLLSKTKWSW